MPLPGILVHPLSASSLIRPSNSVQHDLNPSTRTTKISRRSLHKSIRCKASSSSSFSVTDFDLYDLLGIDSTSNQSQIKTAYRSLQKRCHPDIAGPTGHEMAIILNEVYSILSDPVSRSAYDQEQAKMAEFQGYSGKPLYSTWCGSESEERAVFVDEVKCVGCLKCALLAEKTFAIESVYGRARVIAQWADPEDKILDAIQACPVDCISMVERSNLAALEFLMSKQPRGNVRTSAGKGMTDIKKFQSKLQQAKNKDSTPDPREVAFHSVRSISNWFYWQSPKGREHGGSLIHIAHKSSPFNTNKLRDAAAAARQGFWTPSKPPGTYNVDNDIDYWTLSSQPPGVPQSFAFNGSNTTTSSTDLPKYKDNVNQRKVIEMDDGDPKDPLRLRWTIPMAIATFAASIVRSQVGYEYDAGIEQHIAGPLPLEVVNSSWFQTILAGFTWYIIAFVSVGLVKSLTHKQKM
ncbi:hypothetical protein AQUCO_03500060v1 [Aquilegia coerulea]|uniref:J domain-containing protein n=1 Tax=Aquilegia coerulea TaxID=218851 RepID=A0A2G5CVY0_AQUCA|nr:hypothetical protein AQUCO_03500060v1 [Aquilegia coerulea]